uniref:Ig-like domain-containing protein n=1 Tax=Pygocentrus nattereri TaxID=42514 RepID=A0AAR2LWC2_PYGNA
MVDMGKSRRALRIFVLFVLFSVGPIFCVEVAVETGKNHTFKSSASGKIETILWKFSKNKVVEFEGGDPMWYRFESRADLDTKTGDLTLKQLSKEDNGHYQSEIQVDGKLQYSDHVIKVMDAVPVPNVTCHANSTTATLRCTVDSSVQANLEWSGPNDDKKTEEIIVVPKQQAIYICTAQNALNKASREFSLADCNTDGSDGLLAGILAAVFVLIAGGAVTGVVLYRKKKNCGRNNIEEGFDKNPNNTDEASVLLQETPEINEKSDQALERDESDKSTDNHLERQESHLDKLPSQQNEDKKSQETILKTESEESNKPSEEEEQIPVNKVLTEGNQENTLKTDTEPQIQDAKGQSEEQSVAEEDKEKKEQYDPAMDERPNTSSFFNGEMSPPAEPTVLEETQSENKDNLSGSTEGMGQCVENGVGAGCYSEEKQESAGQNPEESPLAAANGPENPHTENNGNASSSIPDEDQRVKKESNQGRVGNTVKEIESRLWKPREIFYLHDVNTLRKARGTKR